MVKTLHLHCREHRFSSWSGNFPHAAGYGKIELILGKNLSDKMFS